MKTELFLALVLGVSMGILGMLGVVYLSKQVRESKAPTQFISQENPAPTSLELSVKYPQNHTAYSEKAIEVDGTTLSNNSIIFSTDHADEWIKITESGFKTQFIPQIGINNLKFYDTKTLSSQTIEIFSAKGLPLDKPYKEGVVTDITEEYLQLRSTDGTLGQISVNSKTLTLNITKDIKTVSIKDVAIGDAILAVLESKDSVSATAIVIKNGPTTKPSLALTKGTLDSFAKASVTLKVNEELKTIVYNSKTKLVGINEDDTTRTRTKFINSDLGSDVFVTTTATDSAAAQTIFIRPQQTPK